MSSRNVKRQNGQMLKIERTCLLNYYYFYFAGTTETEDNTGDIEN